MFLITTADQRFWKKDEPVLFLGEWCKLYSEKACWENMQQEVLAYHWDDRKELFADYQYLQELYERILAEMAHSLNVIHGEEHAVRYWRIIIGPWLFYFIHIFFDRYVCIQKAVLSGKVSDTIIGSYAKDAWIPLNHDDFCKWMVGDGYNFFLFSRIIQRTGCLPFTTQPVDWRLVVEEELGFRKEQGTDFARKFFQIYEKCLPHRFNKYVLASSYLRSLDQFRLQLSLGQWPSVFFPQVKHVDSKADMGLRAKISLSVKNGDFEELLAEIIGVQIPMAYLEGYMQIKKLALQAYPAKAKVIMTANAHYANEDFKFWTANMVEQGARLLGVQYGGAYGSALFAAQEEHERKVSDVYYTWGWISNKTDKVKPLSAGKLNRLKTGILPNPKGKILLVLGLVPRYSYYLYSTFMSSTGTLAYLRDQFSFVKVLNESARKDLLIRPYSVDYKWSQKERFLDLFPEVVFDTCQKNLIETMRSSRLFIATYNATTYLESFAADFPTIMFWNPEHWEIRSSAQEYFDGLRRVGILHNTPDSAARKVNEIFSDPMAWWRQDDVQRQKNKFCERFAKVSDNWLREWRKVLLEAKNSS